MCIITLHIAFGFDAGLNFARLTGRALFISPKIDPSCPSAANFYENCVKLIRILKVGTFISLINTVELIFAVVCL